MELKITRVKDVKLPKYAHDDDAGLDLYSAEEVILNPDEKKLISTGIKMQIPKGYFGLIKDRSSLAAKHNLHCLAGVIDAGFRGEIKIVMVNLGNVAYKIEKNTRVAQIIIIPVVLPKLVEVDELDLSNRNQSGFGSTGKD